MDYNTLLALADPSAAAMMSNQLLPGSIYGGGMQNNTASTANWGPTDQGLNGLSPGRTAGLSAAGQIPGLGAVASIGNAFNGFSQGAQLAGAIGQLGGGTASTGNILGGGLAGAFGASPNYGAAAMALGMGPDEAAGRLANYEATGRVGTPSQATGLNISSPFSGQGGGATGINADVAVSPASAAAFGGSFAGAPSMGQDTNGVNMAAGPPSAEFGETVGGGDAGSQGGSGSNGGGASGGGSGGGGGANGGGGDNGGGYAGGGTIHGKHTFHAHSGLIHADGLVQGPGGPQSDSVPVVAPMGGFVVPADVVAKIGGGNPMQGGAKLAAAMPQTTIPTAHDGVPTHFSAGEFFVHPSHVAVIGGGDHAAGARQLHQMMTAVRGRA